MPYRTWCFKRTDKLASEEVDDAKERFPEWQRRMLASEGMAGAVHDGKLERKQKKAEKKKLKEKKMAFLAKAKIQWSEATMELATSLGVYPHLHQPTFCREFPCVSLCVCFPEEASS